MPKSRSHSPVESSAGPARPGVGTRRTAAAAPRLDRARIAIGSAAAVLAIAATSATPAWAQTPLQSRLPSGPQSLPRDQAQAALQRGDAAQALSIADTAMKTFPNDARLRFTRAMALQRLDRLGEAEQAFASLTLEFPELPEPYNNLAVVRAAQGKLDLARSALEDAIRAVPSYAPAHENLADIYLQLAVRNLAEASRLEPGNAALAARAKALADAAAAKR